MDNKYFTVSSRKLARSFNINIALRKRFSKLNIGEISQVKSVFGFVRTPVPLYGGRPFRKQISLSFRQINMLQRKGIAFSLTLSNHHFSMEHYRQSYTLLEQLYREGNSVICTNDELARVIRKDFPLFKIHASVIKDIRTLDEIHKALELYDYVVLSPKLNDNAEFLQQIDCKDKIILFASVQCMYYCDPKECFLNVSMVNNPELGVSRVPCPHRDNPEFKKLTVFNLSDEKFTGYQYFKVIL